MKDVFAPESTNASACVFFPKTHNVIGSMNEDLFGALDFNVWLLLHSNCCGFSEFVLVSRLSVLQAFTESLIENPSEICERILPLNRRYACHHQGVFF